MRTALFRTFSRTKYTITFCFFFNLLTRPTTIRRPCWVPCSVQDRKFYKYSSLTGLFLFIYFLFPFHAAFAITFVFHLSRPCSFDTRCRFSTSEKGAKTKFDRKTRAPHHLWRENVGLFIVIRVHRCSEPRWELLFKSRLNILFQRLLSFDRKHKKSDRTQNSCDNTIFKLFYWVEWKI